MISGFGLKSNGGALLTDTTMDYPLDQDELLLMKEVHAKTISSDFDEQLDASEHFYGRNLRFSFTKSSKISYLAIREWLTPLSPCSS